MFASRGHPAVRSDPQDRSEDLWSPFVSVHLDEPHKKHFVNQQPATPNQRDMRRPLGTAPNQGAGSITGSVEAGYWRLARYGQTNGQHLIPSNKYIHGNGSYCFYSWETFSCVCPSKTGDHGAIQEKGGCRAHNAGGLHRYLFSHSMRPCL